jgi:hypothetical protein
MRNIDSIIVHCSATKAGRILLLRILTVGTGNVGSTVSVSLCDPFGWEIGKRSGTFLWLVLIVEVGMNGVSGYVISVDWMRTGVRQIPGR